MDPYEAQESFLEPELGPVDLDWLFSTVAGTLSEYQFVMKEYLSPFSELLLQICLEVMNEMERDFKEK
jgi:hypothetical protein